MGTHEAATRTVNLAVVIWLCASCAGVITALLVLHDMRRDALALKIARQEDAPIKHALVQMEHRTILLHLSIKSLFMLLGVYALLALNWLPELVAWGLVLGNVLLASTLIMQYVNRKRILSMPVPEGPDVLMGKSRARAEMKADADDRTKKENHLLNGGLTAPKRIPRAEAESDANVRTNAESHRENP